MRIGYRISKLRKQKGLSQAELANGIISRTHLSNIEANRFICPIDILLLLSAKLEVPNSYLIENSKNDEILDGLLESFYKVLEEHNSDKTSEIINLFNEIQRNFPYISSMQQEFHFKLLTVYFYLKIQDSAKMKNFFYEEVEPLVVVEDLSLPLKELYYYLKGIVFYTESKFDKSYRSFLKLTQIVEDEKTKAKIYFNLALASFKCKDLYGSVKYGEKAANLYLQQHSWIKAAESYNLIGVICWEMKELKKGELFLKKGIELAKMKRNSTLESKLYHNLGLIFERKGELAESLKYFNLSLQNKIEDEDKILTLRSILETLLKEQDFDLFEFYLKKAYGLNRTLVSNLHLDLIQAKYFLLLGNEEKYIEMMSYTIQVFLKKQIWQPIIDNAEELSDVYAKKNKYKNAYQLLKMKQHAIFNLNREEF
ncbi:helix-turn-helix transcriptional regulator (plasmid) [Alkalihalophilus pseudofirmus]|uniref:helix-turn-helix transcriptional regulator n=1 Tax=Alkalihalophilus pseudofirmus TaxID=79885 RepID=UPI00259BEC15|nr:helix-turn-helix transcriptional regulator [Alkalihalophilus pseudofirmus]WEG19287.1 helix-turn-helix transcriptional regulator [Alkalihalophilus pseudofirmus]